MVSRIRHKVLPQLMFWIAALLCAPALAQQISPDSDYADYPSTTAAPNGDLYTAWVSYDQKGSDLVRLRRRAAGKWMEPVNITPSSGDYFKTAIAIDNSGRVWVSLAARVDDNVDLYTRTLAGGKWSENQYVYYYIRVQQEDGQMAWVTPIWVSYEPK